MDRARNFKFGARSDRRAYKPKNAKVGQKGRGLRHVTYFYNCGSPFISLEQMKLETSNLVCRLTVEPSNQKNAKVGQKGRAVRHVTYFFVILEPPSISLEWVKLQFSVRIELKARKEKNPK